MYEVSIEQLNSLTETCQHIDDPRTPINILHPVENIVSIAIAAILAGSEGPKSIARWARTKREWLKTWLDLPEGKVPSRDCIRTFFGRVKPELFQACFVSWINSLSDLSFVQDKGLTIAIDGKTLRHSYDTGKEQKPLHIVSAWVAEHHLSLGQVATEEKSNEITAIPLLLDQIDIQGAIVTLDAMGCQKKIASQISEQEGGFVIAVKGNQPTLFETIVSFFDRHWRNNDWSTAPVIATTLAKSKATVKSTATTMPLRFPAGKVCFKIGPPLKPLGWRLVVVKQAMRSPRRFVTIS